MHNIPDFLRIPSEMQEHFANGGYIVKRSHDRKGKTHVVIGPDGTKKYFGDAKLGQHPKDPARKKAFYARHKHNLANNPYFRAFARATWAEGGEVPHFDNGGNYGAFYGRRDAAKMQGMFNPTANSMTPSFFAMGGLNQYQSGSTVALNQQQPGTYNLGQMGPADQGSFATNLNQVAAGNYNLGTLGPTNQTANSGQGINTTTPTNYGLIGPTYDNSLNAQPAISSDDQTDEDLGLPTIMGTEGLGQNIKLGPASGPDKMDLVAMKDPSYYIKNPPKPSAQSTLDPNKATDITKKLKTDQYNQHQHYLEGEHLALQGLGKLPYGVANMARTVTSLNKNAPQNAAANLATRFLSDSTNSQVVYGNRGRVNQGGVKYTKYGGSTSFKEGEVLDLSFEEIKKLKDQGYEFQYL